MNVNNLFPRQLKLWLGIIMALGLMVMSGSLFAGQTIGDVASGITAGFTNITLLITGGCYIAGLAFAITAILQFKQHKDNPTQITVGKPISLVFIAAALLFMPSVMKVAGGTMFGTSADVAGPTGTVFTKPGG